MNVAENSPSGLEVALKQYFGFEAFREGQEAIVQRAVEGRDTLALMPTGAGKSLCYQLAAMLRDAPTLVLSPLIALMKDQVDNLPAVVARQTCVINSSLTGGEIDDLLRQVREGKYRLIYAAPERLRRRGFVAALRSIGLGLVVIDEVHCVSMWGHDFRPDYLFIRSALGELGDPAVLGLTATATPATARDIAGGLGRPLDVVRASVVRSNLRYEVVPAADEEEKRRITLEHARRLQGPGIVYARSREKCEKVALLLQRHGVQAHHYHAGMEAPRRARAQEAFLRGNVRVIVATTAFGMGIDKSDIRWVLLYDYPGSLEDYVQRVGRAGRDGELSTCILLAGAADAVNLRRFARGDIPSIDALRCVYRQLRGRSQDELVDIAPEELSEACRLPDTVDARVLTGMLEQVGLIRRTFDSGRAMSIVMLEAPSDTPERIAGLLGRYEEQALARANLMIAFAENDRCRHLQVAEHFGETIALPCGRCDVCDPHESRVAEEPARPLPVDIARAIVDAVASLQWPLGQRSLAALLKGSVSAPPSAQRSRSFAILEAAPEATIKRWIVQLLDGGHLEQYEDGEYRLVRVADPYDLPRIDPPASARRRAAAASSSVPRHDTPLSGSDMVIFQALRDWRRQTADAREVPAYVILPDRVLRSIAGSRPVNEADLAAIKGMGPAKIEQHGRDILSTVRQAALSLD